MFSACISIDQVNFKGAKLVLSNTFFVPSLMFHLSLTYEMILSVLVVIYQSGSLAKWKKMNADCPIKLNFPVLEMNRQANKQKEETQSNCFELTLCTKNYMQNIVHARLWYCIFLYCWAFTNTIRTNRQTYREV